MPFYRAIHGIDFPHPTYEGMSVRLDPGDVCDAIPEGAVEWLVGAGHILPCAAPADAEAKAFAARVATKPAVPQAPKAPVAPAKPRPPRRRAASKG